jgi:hypothetical protein
VAKPAAEAGTSTGGKPTRASLGFGPSFLSSWVGAPLLQNRTQNLVFFASLSDMAVNLLLSIACWPLR